MSVPAYDAGLDLSEVQFPVKGALYYADTSVAFPVDFTDPGVGFTHGGYWTSDGVQENANTSTGTIRLFQDNALAAKPVTDGEYAVTVTLAQTSTQAAELWHGAEVDPVTGFVEWDPARAAGRKNFILDKVAVDPSTGTPIIERSMFEGELTARGTRTTTYGTLSGYPVTVTAYGAIKSGNSSWVSAPPAAWVATTAYAEDDRVTLTGGAVLLALNAGTSDAAEPTAPGVGEVVVDGDIAWRQVA